MAKKTTPAAELTGYVDVGQAAPPFKLADQAGTTHSLKDFAGKWVVLYFYPKDDTSGCTAEACAFNDGLPKFKSSDAVILGVSPDDTKSHAKFVEKYGLKFTLLADPEKNTVQDYGVWREKSMYGRKYMGVERTTYLIDPKGKVAFRWNKVKVTDHAAQVLAQLDAAKKG